MPAIIDLNEALQSPADRRDEFRRLIEDIPYERKGILNSEMYFMWLCAQAVQPTRILESGRARGQSTLILARCFPNAEIISVEHDRNSPDVAIAEARLKNESNVKLLFGDATRLLPAMSRSGDIALIDGPKGFRGVRFALAMLNTGNVSQAFVHDTGPNTAERHFFEQSMPGMRYSDEPEIAEATHLLDEEETADIPLAHRYAACTGRTGYGYGLACLAHNPATNYWALRLRAVFAGARERIA